MASVRLDAFSMGPQNAHISANTLSSRNCTWSCCSAVAIIFHVLNGSNLSHTNRMNGVDLICDCNIENNKGTCIEVFTNWIHKKTNKHTSHKTNRNVKLTEKYGIAWFAHWMNRSTISSSIVIASISAPSSACSIAKLTSSTWPVMVEPNFVELKMFIHKWNSSAVTSCEIEIWNKGQLYKSLHCYLQNILNLLYNKILHLFRYYFGPKCEKFRR